MSTNIHTELIQTLSDHFKQDQRVRAIWVGGSIGRGEGTSKSDLDFYTAVEDEVFEEFFFEVPKIVEELYPIEFKTQFLFRKTNPYERDWFLFLKGFPLYLKVDFHVHTLTSIRGADPDHWKEMVYANWQEIFNPSGVLHRGEPLPIPDKSLYREHVEERLEYFTYIFAYCAQFIMRSDFWNSTAYLHSIRDRVQYLYGIYFDPALLGDSYPKRLRYKIPQEIQDRLDRPRFGDDPKSHGQALLEFMDLFCEIGRMFHTRDQLNWSETFLDQIRREVTTYRSSFQKFTGFVLP